MARDLPLHSDSSCTHDEHHSHQKIEQKAQQAGAGCCDYALFIANEGECACTAVNFLLAVERRYPAPSAQAEYSNDDSAGPDKDGSEKNFEKGSE
jgi:hypothetical protein